MNRISIRRATLSDVDFVADIIINAEKSRTDKNGLALTFGLSDIDFKKYLIKMLEEECDGCELSLSSFLLIEVNGIPVSGLAGWIEGYEDGLPSSIIKSNLIGYCLPPEIMENIKTKIHLLKDVQTPKQLGTFQLEYFYTKEGYKHNSLQYLMVLEEQFFEESKNKSAKIKKCQLHIYANNDHIYELHLKCGFKVTGTYESTNPDILKLLPYNKILLMEKEL